MDSSDYVYGTIFVLYVALFLVIGGYVCLRKKRRFECHHQEDDTKDNPSTTSSKNSKNSKND